MLKNRSEIMIRNAITHENMEMHPTSYKDLICSKDAFNFLFFVEAMNPPTDINLFSNDWTTGLTNQIDNNNGALKNIFNDTKNYNYRVDSRPNHLLGGLETGFNSPSADNRPFKMLSFNPLQRLVNNDMDRKILSEKDIDFQDTDRNFVCKVCGKSFKRKSSLSTHKLIHDNVKPFSCLTCRKTFLRRSDLKKHILMHTGQKPHQCSECGRVFSQSSNMLTHMRRHSGVRPYSCQICGNSFYRKVDVRRHQVKHLKDEETLLVNQKS